MNHSQYADVGIYQWYAMDLLFWHETAESGHMTKHTYRQTSNLTRTEFQGLNDPRPVLKLSLLNPLKPCVKIQLEQRWLAKLQLDLSNQQYYCPLGYGLC